MMLLAKKRILITGVAHVTSLGAATAVVAQGDGAELIITYHPSFEKHARKFTRSIGLDDSRVIPCDVLDKASVDACFAAVEKFGPLDGFVDCIAFADPELLNIPFLDCIENDKFDEAFDHMMRVSVRSFVKLSRRVQKLMNPAGGSIVTLTYKAADRANQLYGMMTAAKGGQRSIIPLLAVEYGQFNIRVNTVSASPEKTPSGLAFKRGYPIGLFEEAMSPLGRRAEPVEIAYAICHLLSDRARAITGYVHLVDCGVNSVGMVPWQDRNKVLMLQALEVPDDEIVRLGFPPPAKKIARQVGTEGAGKPSAQKE